MPREQRTRERVLGIVLLTEHYLQIRIVEIAAAARAIHLLGSSSIDLRRLIGSTSTLML
jgi:hypothetical protein